MESTSQVKETALATGSFAYLNMRSFRAGKPQRSWHESAVYSDSHIVNEILQGLGPYTIYNMIGLEWRYQDTLPYLALREGSYGDSDAAHATHIDDKHYVGTNGVGEVVSLLSLSLGVRLAVGGIIRWGVGDEVAGRPRSEDPAVVPSLPRSRQSILPYTKRGSVDVATACPLLLHYFTLSPSTATAVARAARFYQQAIWYADASPEFAWLMLVAALETAAIHAFHEVGIDPVAELRLSFPAVASELEKVGKRLQKAGDDKDILLSIASRMTKVLGATQKFRLFMDRFMPGPPTQRPLKWAQVDWAPDVLSASVNQIYGFRSKALHEGIPFPLPMCTPPIDAHGLWEIPPSTSKWTSSGFAQSSTDAPMYLHVFEHIARGALLNWWHQLPSETETEGAVPR